MVREAKLDVLDMVIDILVDHEKKLDALVGRLEGILEQQQLLENWR